MKFDISSLKCRFDPKSRSFFISLGIYLLNLTMILLLALLLLRNRADAYERSRPHTAMDAMMASTAAEDWHDILASQGISEHYIATLELNHAAYDQDPVRYTDEAPVYSIHFGGTVMLYVTLQPEESPGFGFNTWSVASIEPVKSGFSIYAPADAIITADGQPIGTECMTQEHAIPVIVSRYEEGRQDLPGLARYEADHIFDSSGITVTNAQGHTLELSYQTEHAAYFAPLTEDYTVTAPLDATVSVNGIVLSERDAFATSYDTNFEGLESDLPFLPGTVCYELNGLLLRPEITAVTADGTVLTATERDNHFTFAREHNEMLAAEQESYIFDAFDAYIAFSGNRNNAIWSNYRHLLSYLVPDSEQAARAFHARESLLWASNRDKSMTSCRIGEVLSFSKDFFTARIDFTMADDVEDYANSLLFIFVLHEDTWKIIRIQNTTTFLFR